MTGKFRFSRNTFQIMKIKICVVLLLLSVFCFNAFAQAAAIPQGIMIRIVRAEDELRFDNDLQNLMKSPNADVRERAALAAGRIGSEAAIESLTALLEKDRNENVRAMAAFALGEIESAKTAQPILKVLQNNRESSAIRARAVEAAGKISAANAKDARTKDLSEAILDALEAEHAKTNPHRETVLLGLTAALRAKPAEADLVVAKFLTYKDERIRADALNTLARLRAKNENTNAKMRALLLSDESATVRANAARALGAAEDKTALSLLIEAATTDDDSRVRVSAIRSLASLKDKSAAAPLLTHGEKLYQQLSAKVKPLNKPAPNNKQYSPFYPSEQNELLEIFTTLGRILANTDDKKILNLLHNFMTLNSLESPEAAIAASRISPRFLSDNKISFTARSEWKTQVSLKSAFGEAANLERSLENDKLRLERTEAIRNLIEGYKTSKEDLVKAIPDSLRAFAAFKTEDLSEILREQLKATDVIVRATAAELISNEPTNSENIGALKIAFKQSLETDKQENDAQLAILSALLKLSKNEAVNSLKAALDAPDYLVRRHAAQLIKQNDLTKEFPNVDAKLATVKPHDPASGTKLGQILNTEADYQRAISRKNWQTKAIVTTEKGAFTIEFFPEDAPLAVDNFIKLAKSNYFNNVAVHRVVPNFVMQDGDPRGDGNGSPGWQIRCEVNQIPYERGAVGMALSGKDTGGSQWFVTHSPQPHLDGGYTVFGRVNETDMKVVDNIARGDKIIRVTIVEGKISRKSAKTQRKTK
jgi:cyclophilin family peptidyl-prolyl cis-trans isomerase/HEAT repeat protein